MKRFWKEKFLFECFASVVSGQRCDMDSGFLDAGERVLTHSNFYRVNECVSDAAEQDLGWARLEAKDGLDHSTSELHMKRMGLCIYVCICGVCVGGCNNA